MDSLYQLLDPKERTDIELKKEFADTQARIDKGLVYLEAHSGKEPLKTDQKYEVWIDTFLRYTERYHELVVKEKELLTEIEELNIN